MVHMHHSQPLKMKFGTNHFLGSETLVPLQYRVRVKKIFNNVNIISMIKRLVTFIPLNNVNQEFLIAYL